MSDLSPSSPLRETPMSQEEEIGQLASEMDWGDAGVESGDDEGPQKGQGAYVAGVWLDALDPHLITPRQRSLLSDFDPDYVPSSARVRTYSRAFIVHFLRNTHNKLMNLGTIHVGCCDRKK